MKKHFTLTLLAIGLGVFQVLAQTQVPLEDMSNFREQAGNWQIVGDVIMDRSLDIHHDAEPEPQKKKKK
ncbi:MAG: hypothetical protein AAGA85_06715, partial [Bacteroidota bacterium]